MKILDKLTPEQYKAATEFYGPMLILAGAGSGKTTTIVARTANMMYNGIDGRNILVLTFTNKAAKEMKDRGMAMIKGMGDNISAPTFTTFHSFGYKFLKRYLVTETYLKLKANFTLADEGVQLKIIKNIIKGMFLNKEKKITERNIYAIIGILQNNLIGYDEKIDITFKEIQELIRSYSKSNKSLGWLKGNGIETKDDIVKLSKIYFEYKKQLRENNLVDFDDLINLPIKILKKNKEIKNFINKKFKYIMVDEFQDTNYSQIELLNLILNKDDNICVVGDDSQSIYGWRGADIDYILNFHKQYRKVKKINLKENFRSTKNIVKKANKLISKAEEKHEFKEALVAFKKEKGYIKVQEYRNQWEEAQEISRYIKGLINKKVEPKDIAVLYRNNFIASAFEKELIKNKIPYRIYKGRALMQKKIIHEYMSIFQFLVNKTNSIALETALIASKILTEKKIEEIKQKQDLRDFIFLKNKDSLFDDDTNHYDKLSKTQKERVEKFKKNINIATLMMKNEENIEDIVNFINREFLLLKNLKKTIETSKSANSVAKAERELEDINVLISIINDFLTIEEFIEEIGLDENTDKKEEDLNKVNLMTMHSAKGLEFDCVFLPRMNEGVLPSTRSLTNLKVYEEERRLAYVALTRAKRFLHVSYVQIDMYKKAAFPSAFIKEAGLY